MVPKLKNLAIGEVQGLRVIIAFIFKSSFVLLISSLNYTLPDSQGKI